MVMVMTKQQQIGSNKELDRNIERRERVEFHKAIRTLCEFDQFTKHWITNRNWMFAEVHFETWNQIITSDVSIEYKDKKSKIHHIEFKQSKDIPIGVIRLTNGYMYIDIPLNPKRCGNCNRWMITDGKFDSAGIVSICAECAPKLRPNMYE